ncbi:MAG TPA: dicarboxylate/amino acid:cation symporter [Gemmatimonadales bacterium]|jgi:proton glutamate symport protein|nr:dicarboxylate/amino acid:cation symporter [Gemmatimonadales bacterium]
MIASLRRIGLTGWIIIAMIVGITLGWLDHDLWHDTTITPVAQPLATLFLRMIKSIVVPLVFSSLVVGIAGHGDDLKKVGRLALRSLVYFELVTTVALGIGLLAVNLARPGAGVDIQSASAELGQQFASTHTTLSGVLEHAVPQSFFEAAAKNEVLQIVFFAVLFGIALAQVPSGRGKEIVLRFCEGLAEVMFKFTALVMYFAPIGIGAALAVTIGANGLGVLGNLVKLVLTLYGALVVFVLLVLVPVAVLFKVPVRAFWKYVKEPWLIAFSTASSEAALPLAMENLDKFGVPKRIVAFVLPTGYSFNLDGSTLYLAVASVFVAQAAGVPMTLGTQLVMMLTLMLTSKGVAAVPRASLVILSGTLASFGLPLEGVAVILGVDAIMDMARTSVNLVGNCLASAVMGRWEDEYTPGSEFDPARVSG